MDTQLLQSWRPLHAAGHRDPPILFSRKPRPFSRGTELPCCSILLCARPTPCGPGTRPGLPSAGARPARSPARVSRLSLCGRRSCVCLVYSEWHWRRNSDLSHETVWEMKFPLSKFCHVSTSCSASNFCRRRRELSAETCQ